MNRAVLASSFAVLGIAGAAAAFAQTSGAPGAGPAPGPGPRGMPMQFMGGPEMLCTSPGAVLAGGTAFYEKRLGITDAQRPAWNKLADALKAAEPALKTICDVREQHRAETAPAPLPDRLASMQKVLATGLDQLNRIQPLVADVYNQLTPEQKAIADRIGPHRGGRHGDDRDRNGGPEHGHMGGHMMGGPGNPPPADGQPAK
jgi:hypothetical protein